MADTPSTWTNQGNTALHNAIQVNAPVSSLNYIHFSSETQVTGIPQFNYKRMPAEPVNMFGREREKVAIIRILRDLPKPRIAIIGAGGLGKTALALSVLHDAKVTSHFQKQYFVSCEAATSVDQLLAEFADVLEIPATERGPKVLETIINMLSRSSTLLCLDNFETPWLEAKQRHVEDFMNHLNSIRPLAIIVTTRVSDLPVDIDWSSWMEPESESLQPLTMESTWCILDKIARRKRLNSGDQYVRKLLDLVEGVPLAATLLGQLLNSFETPEELWKRWESKGTSMISRRAGEEHRLASVDSSIHLSLTCRYMRERPDAQKLLSLLAILPDGFPDSSDRRMELVQHLPATFSFSDALSTLIYVSLVYIDTAAFPRIRLLPPIRHFCQSQLPLALPLKDAMTEFYAHLIRTRKDRADVNNHGVVPYELKNIEALLLAAFKLKSQPIENLVKAAINCAEWSIYVGLSAPALITLAIEHSRRLNPAFQAASLTLQGYALYRDNRLDDARKYYAQALPLYQRAKDIAGEGDLLHSLGDLQMKEDEFDNARASYTRAIQLHRQARSVSGEANGLRLLGKLQMRQGKLDDAQRSIMQAIELRRKMGQMHMILDEANDLGVLGSLQMRQGNYDTAEVSLLKAIELHGSINNILGEANDRRLLGEALTMLKKYDEAEDSLNQSIKLQQRLRNGRGEAAAKYSLSSLKQLRTEFEAANASQVRAATFLRWGRSDKEVAFLPTMPSTPDDVVAQKPFRYANHVPQWSQDLYHEVNVQVERRMPVDEAMFRDLETHLSVTSRMHSESKDLRLGAYVSRAPFPLPDYSGGTFDGRGRGGGGRGGRGSGGGRGQIRAGRRQ